MVVNTQWVTLSFILSYFERRRGYEAVDPRAFKNDRNKGKYSNLWKLLNPGELQIVSLRAFLIKLPPLGPLQILVRKSVMCALESLCSEIRFAIPRVLLNATVTVEIEVPFTNQLEVIFSYQGSVIQSILYIWDSQNQNLLSLLKIRRLCCF